ncbi:MAG: GDSL-type esterase/lipase family protein, partial [Oscillospiraceae bacterium]
PKIAYDFSKPVPAVAEAADSFFKTVLFVGDSRLFGLSIPGAELLASGRVSVSTALNFKYEFGEGTATLAERLDARQFSAIYINMGLNELGWEYPDLFIKAYAELIDVIRETQPDAEIYIDAVFPVSSEVTAKTSYLDNKKITLYNSLLLKLASEKGCRYLDLTEVFADADGNLLEGSTTNGINPTKDYFNKWHAYLKTHTVSKEYYGN